MTDEAEGSVKCGKTGKPCDPESKYCSYYDTTYTLSLNKTCPDIIIDEEAEG